MWPLDPDGFEPFTEPQPDHELHDAWYFVVLEGRLLTVLEAGAPRPVLRDEYRWLDLEIHGEHYLGRYRGRACFAVEASGRAPEGYGAATLFDWLGRCEAPLFYLAGRAQQTVDWDRNHRFCGRCGHGNEDHPLDRAKHSPQCGRVQCPRLAPSIIVLVTDGDRVLLARNHGWPPGLFSTLAGFVEPGESVEQTVHREVAEEVGVRVDDLRYLGSQSWPFPNSLMLGFQARYAGGDIVCDDEEVAEARWFHLDDLPDIPPPSAISRWLIDDYCRARGLARGRG